MSHIFEALQKSDAARNGEISPSHPLALATELLQAAEHDGRYTANTSNTAAADAPHLVEGTTEFPQFPSLNVTIPAASRLVSLTDKESLAAEKFRFLGVRMRQLQHSRQVKRLLITSTIPEEGKSMVTANLVITLARKKQQRILLLEGDLRRPVLASRLGLPRVSGLSEWLAGEPCPINAIYHLEQAGFWFLPAGHPPENPLELMQAGRLSKLMDHLTSWFDWVVIDSPPILPLADTSVWSRLADGILLVTREGTTQKRELQRGVQALDQTKLVGVVVNSCDDTDQSNYYQRYSPTAVSGAGER